MPFKSATAEAPAPIPLRREPAIPLSEPMLAGREWQYVRECLDSGWVSSAGPFVDRFERAFARSVARRHAVAMASGTAALHIALLAAGVEPGDEVWMPGLTFIAPANAVRYLGGHPVFFDAEPAFWQMDAVCAASMLRGGCDLERGRARNRRTGRRVAALLPVHILGHPADLDPLVGAAGELGIPIVEDATESLGARRRGRPVGATGLAACFSFNGNKLITAGGGGMLATDDEAVARKARYLSTQAKDDPLEYVHASVGFNYRLTNLQAALGCAQLEQMSAFLDARRSIAARYREGLAGLGCEVLGERPGVESAFWLSSMRAPGRSSRPLLRHLHAAGVLARPLWQPLHRSPAHAADRPPWDLPVADLLHREALSLPSSASLSPAAQDRVIGAIAEFLRSV